EDRATEFLVRARRQPGATGLVEATLTIRKADRHAVAQTLVVNDAGDVREFALTETSLAVLPASTVPAAAFVPEPELAGIEKPEPTPPAPPAAVVREAKPIAAPIVDGTADGVELDALFTTHRLERAESIAVPADADALLASAAAALAEAREIERVA